MENEASQNESIKKLGELIKDIDFAMLTTSEADGTLRSRPMATQKIEFDGDLWFFTGKSTPKVSEIQNDQQVNVSYASIKDQRYVSVSGRASLVNDRQKMKELWNPAFKAWFPKGLDDQDLVLLKVSVDQVQYWDSPSSKVVQLVGFAKAIVTGQRYEGGENATINL